MPPNTPFIQLNASVNRSPNHLPAPTQIFSTSCQRSPNQCPILPNTPAIPFFASVNRSANQCPILPKKPDIPSHIRTNHGFCASTIRSCSSFCLASCFFLSSSAFCNLSSCPFICAFVWLSCLVSCALCTSSVVWLNFCRIP